MIGLCRIGACVALLGLSASIPTSQMYALRATKPLYHSRLEAPTCHFPEWIIDDDTLYSPLKGLLRTMNAYYDQIQAGDVLMVTNTRVVDTFYYVISARPFDDGRLPVATIRKSLGATEAVNVYSVAKLAFFVCFYKDPCDRLAPGLYVKLLHQTPRHLPDSLADVDEEKHVANHRMYGVEFTPSPPVPTSPLLPSTAAVTPATISLQSANTLTTTASLLSVNAERDLELFLAFHMRDYENPFRFASMSHEEHVSTGNGLDAVHITAVVEDAHADQSRLFTEKLFAESPAARARSLYRHAAFDNIMVDMDVGVVAVALSNVCFNSMKVLRFHYVSTDRRSDDVEMSEIEHYPVFLEEAERFDSESKTYNSSSFYLRRKNTNQVWGFKRSYAASTDVYFLIPEVVHDPPLFDEVDKQMQSKYYTYLTRGPSAFNH